MKGIKKLLTGVLAATLIMSASITAFASEGGSEIPTEQSNEGTDATAPNSGTVKAPTITITHDVVKGAEDRAIRYDYYQILKADIDTITAPEYQTGEGQTGTAAYYVDNSTLATALEGTNLFKVTKVTDSRWNVELKDEKTTAEALRVALNTDPVKNAVSTKGNFSSTKLTDPDVDKDHDRTQSVSYTLPAPGYYLIVSNLGTVAALQTLSNVSIKEKNSFPGVTKTKSDLDVYARLGVGSTLTYTLDVDVVPSVKEEPVVVVDTATKGLTLHNDIKATVEGAAISGISESWEKSTDSVNNGAAYVYKVTIPANIVKANAGKHIILTYTAEINTDAVIFDPENNTAHIEYENYKSAETTPVVVKTSGFKIFKYTKNAKNEEIALVGAAFSVWTKDKNSDGTSQEGDKQIYVEKIGDGYYRVTNDATKNVAIEVVTEPKTYGKITVSKGEAVVDGLELTTYYLQEDKAPKGYNLLKGRQAVTVTENNMTAETIKTESVLNNAGSVLPSTGGIGTTIFYILGGILIVAGVAYFIVRRKASVE